MGQHHPIQIILEIGKQDFYPQFETPSINFYGARYLNTDLSIWLSVDPMSDKYPHLTSYNYCANNPIMLIDPDGRDVTDYRNRKGELLYKTNDKLNDVIVVPDIKIKEFKNKLNVLYKIGKLNDVKANKDNLHVLGVKIEKLKDQIMTKDPSMDAGAVKGYEDGYKGKELGGFTKILRFIMGAESENSKINSGYISAKPIGEYDKKQRNINKIDPYSSLKNNKPLLDPQKDNDNNRKMNTNNKVD